MDQGKDTLLARYILSPGDAFSSSELVEVRSGLLGLVADLKLFYAENQVLWGVMGDPASFESVLLGMLSHMLTECRSRFESGAACPETPHVFLLLNSLLHHAIRVDADVTAAAVAPVVFKAVLFKIAWASVFLANHPGVIQIKFSERTCGALKYGSMHHSFRSRKRTSSKAPHDEASRDDPATDAETGVLIMMCLLTHPSDLRKNASWASFAEKPWIHHLARHQAEYFGSFCSMVMPSAFSHENVTASFLKCEFELSHELRLALIRELADLRAPTQGRDAFVSPAVLYVGACMVMINTLATGEHPCSVLEVETFIQRLSKAVSLLNMAYMDEEVRSRVNNPGALLLEASTIPDIEQAFYFAALSIRVYEIKVAPGKELALVEHPPGKSVDPEASHANEFARCMSYTCLPGILTSAQMQTTTSFVKSVLTEDGDSPIRDSMIENASKMYVCLSCQKIKTHVFASPGSAEKHARKRATKVKNTNVTVTSMQDPNKPVSRAFGLTNTMVDPFATHGARNKPPADSRSVYSLEPGLTCMESACEKSMTQRRVVRSSVLGRAVSVPGSGVYTMSPCCARLVEMDSLVAQNEDCFMCVPCANTTAAKHTMLEQCADYLAQQRNASHYNSVRRITSARATDALEGPGPSRAVEAFKASPPGQIACLYCDKKFSAWAPNTYRVCTMTDHRHRQGVVYLCRRKHYFSVFDTKVWDMRKAIIYIQAREK